MLSRYQNVTDRQTDRIAILISRISMLVCEKKLKWEVFVKIPEAVFMLKNGSSWHTQD